MLASLGMKFKYASRVVVHTVRFSPSVSWVDGMEMGGVCNEGPARSGIIWMISTKQSCIVPAAHHVHISG